jgi:hypothetical protein
VPPREQLLGSVNRGTAAAALKKVFPTSFLSCYM